MKNVTSTNETGSTTTSYLDVHSLDITKGMALSGTGKTTSLTTSSTLTKSSVAGSSITITRVVTPTSLMNTMEETIDFGQILKDRIAELENELRLVQLREKVAKSVKQENQTSTTISSPIPFPIGKLNFTDIRISSMAHAITAPVTSWPSILLPTGAIQQLTESTKTWMTSTLTTAKLSSYPTPLITTSLSATLASSTPTALFPYRTSQQTLAVTSTTKPAGTLIVLTTTPSKDSTASLTVASRTTPMVKSTTAAATRLASTRVVSIAKSTTSTALLTPTPPTSGTTSTVYTTRKTSAATIRQVSVPTTTATSAVTKIPKTTLAFTSTTLSTTLDDAPSTESSKPETSTLPSAGEVLLTLLNLTGSDVTSPKRQLNPMNASLSTEAQAALVTSSAEEQVSPTSTKAMTNLPPTTGLLLPSMQTAIPSSSTEKAFTSSSMITATSQTLPAMNATTRSVLSSTKSISTLTTTPSSIGFINLTGVLDSISKLVGRRDLFAHRLRKRSSASTVAPAINSADTLTADHIPIYFEQVFFFVQTSLYVCTVAGLLIFFSSLIGICGGLFRIDSCLKFVKSFLWVLR